MEVVQVERLLPRLDSWFPSSSRTPDARVMLFCLPYAGGAASVFRGWADGLPDDVECVAVHLPGREARVAESPAIDVVELSRAIARRAVGRPYALFGHSMGARLAFEVARQMRRDGEPMPVQLIVGGSRPPHMDTPLNRIARLPDAEFCARVIAMGGTPPGVFEMPELRDLLLPVLRSDFALVESYRFRGEPALPVPITAFAGADDRDAPSCDVAGWSAHTSEPMRLVTLPGAHFFLHSARDALLGAIGAELAATRLCYRLDPDEVFVREARLDELPDLCGAVGELSASETARLASIRLPIDRARFVGRTVFLRRTLRDFGVEVGTSELPDRSRAKPAGGHQPDLRFDTSHAGDVALIAITVGREIGLGVERSAPIADLDAVIATGLCDEERAQLAYLPDDEVLGTVLRIATAKEALRSAIGDDLTVEPSEMCFADQDSRPWRTASRPYLAQLLPWRVHHLDLGGAIGALALATDAWRLRFETMRGGAR